MKTITIEVDEDMTRLLEAARVKVAMLRGLETVSDADLVRAGLEVLESLALPEELAPVSRAN